MRHVTINFGPIQVPADTVLVQGRVRVYRVDALNATVLVEALAQRRLVDIAINESIVILNAKGSFVKSCHSGFLVTLVPADLTTTVKPISKDDFDHLNAFDQCRLSKRKCPSEKLNDLPGTPSPQVLELTSFGTRLDGKWGITGVIGGLSPHDIVSQVKHHDERNQSYNITCEGLTV